MEINAELIIHRLDQISSKQDALAVKQEELNSKLENLTLELVKLQTIEHTVNNIKEWKEKVQETISTSELKELKGWKMKMEELMSPKQLEAHIKEHDSFKTFKNQAMMIWVIVQALIALAVLWDKLFT